MARLTTILGRIGIALIGYFLIFDVRSLILWTILEVEPTPWYALISGPLLSLQGALLSMLIYPVLLVVGLFTQVMGGAVPPEELIGLAILVVRNIVFLIVLVGSVIWFERRRQKNRKDIILFYLLILPIVFFLGQWLPAVLW